MIRRYPAYLHGRYSDKLFQAHDLKAVSELLCQLVSFTLVWFRGVLDVCSVWATIIVKPLMKDTSSMSSILKMPLFRSTYSPKNLLPESAYHNQLVFSLCVSSSRCSNSRIGHWTTVKPQSFSFSIAWCRMTSALDLRCDRRAEARLWAMAWRETWYSNYQV